MKRDTELHWNYRSYRPGGDRHREQFGNKHAGTHLHMDLLCVQSKSTLKGNHNKKKKVICHVDQWRTKSMNKVFYIPNIGAPSHERKMNRNTINGRHRVTVKKEKNTPSKVHDTNPKTLLPQIVCLQVDKHVQFQLKDRNWNWVVWETRCV